MQYAVRVLAIVPTMHLPDSVKPVRGAGMMAATRWWSKDPQKQSQRATSVVESGPKDATLGRNRSYKINSHRSPYHDTVPGFTHDLQPRKTMMNLWISGFFHLLALHVARSRIEDTLVVLTFLLAVN